MYKTCKNQKERIQANLVHYKGYLIIKKLIARFTMPELKKNAAKVIKIQIKYMDKRWRKNNMKIVSIPYSFVDLNIEDEWLALDSSPAEEARQKKMLNEDEIRQFNNDFNTKHYQQFDEEADSKKEGEDADENKEQPKVNPLNCFQKMVGDQNLLSKMWNKVEVKQEFYDNYEQWLEDEVWTYFD